MLLIVKDWKQSKCQFVRKWLHKLCYLPGKQLKKEGKCYYEIIIMKTFPGHNVKVQNNLRKRENENIYVCVCVCVCVCICVYICFICTKKHCWIYDKLIKVIPSRKQRCGQGWSIGAWLLNHVSFYQLLIYK